MAEDGGGVSEPTLPQDDCQEIHDLYDKADRFVREVSVYRGEVLIPAINELRYAGHHVIQSLSPDCVARDGENLRKAKNHCERAMYEAAEAGIMATVEAILSFREAFPNVVIRDVVPEYPEAMLLARSGRDQVVEGRANRDSVSGQTEAYMTTYRSLQEHLTRLEVNRDDLTAKAAAIQKADRQFLTTWITRIAVAAAAILATVALAIFGR